MTQAPAEQSKTITQKPRTIHDSPLWIKDYILPEALAYPKPAEDSKLTDIQLTVGYINNDTQPNPYVASLYSHKKYSPQLFISVSERISTLVQSPEYKNGCSRKTTC